MDTSFPIVIPRNTVDLDSFELLVSGCSDYAD